MARFFFKRLLVLKSLRFSKQQGQVVCLKIFMNAWLAIWLLLKSISELVINTFNMCMKLHICKPNLSLWRSGISKISCKTFSAVKENHKKPLAGKIYIYIETILKTLMQNDQTYLIYLYTVSRNKLKYIIRKFRFSN